MSSKKSSEFKTLPLLTALNSKVTLLGVTTLAYQLGVIREAHGIGPKEWKRLSEKANVSANTLRSILEQGDEDKRQDVRDAITAAYEDAQLEQAGFVAQSDEDLLEDFKRASNSLTLATFGSLPDAVLEAVFGAAEREHRLRRISIPKRREAKSLSEQAEADEFERRVRKALDEVDEGDALGEAG